MNGKLSFHLILKNYELILRFDSIYKLIDGNLIAISTKTLAFFT